MEANLIIAIEQSRSALGRRTLEILFGPQKEIVGTQIVGVRTFRLVRI